MDDDDAGRQEPGKNDRGKQDLGKHDDVVLVYATCPSVVVAEAVGTPLVESGIAACLNILPAMTSIYRWQGRLHKDDECVLIIKTRASLAGQVIAEASARHPYDEPAFLMLPVAGGSQGFIDWIRRETTSAVVGSVSRTADME